MVQKVAPSLPSRIFTAVMPQNRIVHVALGIIAALVVVKLVKGLFGRAIPKTTATDEAAKAECKKGKEALARSLHADASVYFQKAYDLQPTDKDLRASICLEMASLLKSSDKKGKASALLDEVVQMNPPNIALTVDAHIQKNIICDREKNYAIALAHLNKALSLNEDESMVPGIHLRMAYMHVKSHQWTEADVELTLALAQEKQSRFFCSLLMGIADISLHEGQLVLARRGAESAMRYWPDGDTKMQAETEYVMAKVYGGEKNFKKCYEMLGEALTHFPYQIDTLRAEVLCQRALIRNKIADGVDFPAANSYQDALNSFSLSLDAIPAEKSAFRAVVHWWRAAVHSEWGDRDAALVDLREANKCPSKTEQIAKKIQALELEIGLTYVREAIEHHAQGNNAKALAALTHLLDVVKPTDKKQLRDVYVLMGEIYSDLGNFDEALAAYGLALGLDPSELEKTCIQVGMSCVFVQQGEPAKAMETAQAALDAFPGKDKRLVSVLMMLSELESDPVYELQYAKDAFIRVPDDLPDLGAKTLRQRATLHFKQENYAEAVKYLKTALEWISEENIVFRVQCYMELGLAYKAMGKKELALAEFLSAQKLSQDAEVKERIAQEIHALYE